MRVEVASGPGHGAVALAAGERFTIGRGTSCDVVIAGDAKVSNLHAYLKVVDGEGAIIHDCGSTNGTFVDGTRIVVPRMLRGGEEVRVGDTLLLVSSDDGERRAAAALAGPTEQRAPRIDAAPVDPAPMGQSTLQRLVLARSVRKATVLSIVALIAMVVVVALFVADVLPGRKAPVTPKATTAADVVDAVRPSTVQVETQRDGTVISGGSGWVLDAAQGLVMTNNHVTNGGTTFTVAVGDDQRSAQLVAAAPCDDLALLKVTDTTRLTTIPLGTQRDLKLGEPVLAVGFPTNGSARRDLTATSGVVSVARTSLHGSGPEPDLANVVQTDAAINPGNSGGPLVSSGRVLVGVNTATVVSTGGRALQNANFAIGVDRVKEVAADLRQGRSMAWTGLGLESPSADTNPADLGLPARPGLIVTAAVPGTPAAAAGLGNQPALLVAVDGRPIDDNVTSYCDAVRSRRGGEKARFSIVRAGTTEATDVTVAFA